MLSRRDPETAVSDGLIYLLGVQLSDGGFESYSSPAGQRTAVKRARRTTFVPALMLGSLSGVHQSFASAICQKLSVFLWEQRSLNGGFNYWAKDAPERQLQPYPDDLDDTCSALISLYRYCSERVDEAVLADTVKLLLATETSVGGPYRTWIVAPGTDRAWLDVDLAVNAVVAYFLSLVTDRLPALDRMLSAAIRDNKLASPYYPDIYPVLYYLSRVCPPPEHSLLLDKVRRALLRNDLTPLSMALCLNASLNLGEQRPDILARLLEAQQTDGSWAGSAYCIDLVHNGRMQVHGAPALTTAFALEALARSMELQLASQVAGNKRTEKSLHQEVMVLVEKQLHDVPPDLSRLTRGLLSKLIASSTGKEIIELPSSVCESIKYDRPAPSMNLLQRLSLANLYGWLAYSIYDDVIDGEGKGDALPAANLAMRYSLAAFSEVMPFHQSFQQSVRQVFDTIDGANAWELAHCRFARRGRYLTVGSLPDYGDLSPLANRSLGHALPPLAVLLAAGVDDNSIDHVQLRRTMTHYLIARQLNDDAHDWPDDLKHGRISYVVGRLLSAGPARKPGKYVLSDLLATAYQQFWHAELPAVCMEIRRQVNLGRRALHEVSVLKRQNHIAQLLDDIDSSVDETLAKHRQAQTFLKHYEKSSVKV